MNITLTKEQRASLEKEIDSRWDEVLKMKQINAFLFFPNWVPNRGQIRREYTRVIKEIIFIKKSDILHNGDYDYSKVYYVNNGTKVIIICPIHGDFSIRPNDHLQGRGCCKCAGKGLSTEEWVERFREAHGDKYNYDKFVYNGVHAKSIVTCPEHGDFLVTPSKHLIGQGCPRCNTSKGEIQIENYLKNKNIKYETQKKFEGCKYKQSLPFDFYLPDYNLLIEFQGEQHYKIIKHFGGERKFERRQKRDQIKRDFCSKPENPDLLEIKYTEINNINEILEETLKL